MAHLIQTKAEFSYASAVMDSIGGWIEIGRIEDGRPDWRKTGGVHLDLFKAVICNGQHYMEGFRNLKILWWRAVILGLCKCAGSP